MISETIVAGACWLAEGVHRNDTQLQNIVAQQLSLVAEIAQIVNPLDDPGADMGSFEVEQLVDGPWDCPPDDLFDSPDIPKNWCVRRCAAVETSFHAFWTCGLAQPTRRSTIDLYDALPEASRECANTPCLWLRGILPLAYDQVSKDDIQETPVISLISDHNYPGNTWQEGQWRG